MERYIKKFQLENVMHEPLLKRLTLVEYAKGELIIEQGAQPEFLYFLVEGRTRVYATSIEGRRLIFAFNRPFGVIGDIEFIQQAPYLNTVEAVSDVKMLRLPLEDVRQIGMHHLPFMTFILEILTNKFYSNANTSRFNLMYGVDVRLASYLLSMTAEGDAVSIHDLRDAADLIGTSYRHLNRMLAQFIEEGLVARKNRTIVTLDRARLYELAKQNIYEER